MHLQTVLQELEELGTERTKKVYISQGACEPLFGVATGAMKPLVKKIKINQPLADELYETGNYDAMYLAGMVADPKLMTEADFDRWIKAAYFHMISDYIVAITLAETNIAQAVSDKWIASGKELYISAGYNCYGWLIGNRRDVEFEKDKLNKMLEVIEKTIHDQPKRAKFAMNSLVGAIGISYLPLHEKAISVANNIKEAEEALGNEKCVLTAAATIQQAISKGRVGFKRKNVRC